MPTIIKAEVINNTVNNVTIIADVIDTITGENVPNGPVKVLVNDTVVGTGEVIDGKVTILTNISEKGLYDINVVYMGTEKYDISNDLLEEVEVVGKISEIIPEVLNNTLGNTTINVTLIDPETNDTIPNAPIIVTLPNGTEINTTTDNNGSVVIPVDLPVGPNDVNITYPGNNTYNGTSTNLTITVEPRDSVTEAAVINNTAGNVTITANVTDATTGEVVPNGPVEVLVNGTVVGTGEVVDGKVTILTNITEKGVYDFDVVYRGNENYTESNDLLEDVEVVGRESDIVAKPGNTTLGNTTIDVNLTDSVTGELIKSATVIVTLPNGTNITAITDDNGSVTVPVDLPVGDNNITVTYPGNETYNATSTDLTVTVEPRASVTEASVINNTAGNVTLDVLVTDAGTGEVVPNGPVIVLVNGTVVGKGEIVDGKVTIVTDIAEKGIYNIDVVYEGNENYTESNDLLEDVEVVSKDSVIISEVTNDTVGNTIIKVTLVDPETNKTIPNAPIIVTLPNGTEINTNTDENGTAIIPVDLPAGENNVTVRYPGNETYNASNSTIPVNVFKRNATLTPGIVNNTDGKVTIVINATDSFDKTPITNGVIELELPNGSKVTGELTDDGTVTFKDVEVPYGITQLNATLIENPTYNTAETSILVNSTPSTIIIKIGEWKLVCYNDTPVVTPTNKTPAKDKVNKIKPVTNKVKSNNNRNAKFNKYNKNRYNKPSLKKASHKSNVPKMSKLKYRIFITLYKEYFNGNMSYSDFVAILKQNGIEIGRSNAWNSNGEIILEYETINDVPDTIELHDNSEHLGDYSQKIDKTKAQDNSGVIDSGDIEVESKAPATASALEE